MLKFADAGLRTDFRCIVLAALVALLATSQSMHAVHLRCTSVSGIELVHSLDVANTLRWLQIVKHRNSTQ